MKYYLLILLVVFCSIKNINAQDYKTAVGIRMGAYNGLTLKHFTTKKTAIEALLVTRYKGVLITGLYEFQNRLLLYKRLGWYYGVGAHLGTWNSAYYGISTTGNYTEFGFDGIFGLEYNFKKFPFNVSLDWKPSLNIIGSSQNWSDGKAISVRFKF